MENSSERYHPFPPPVKMKIIGNIYTDKFIYKPGILVTLLRLLGIWTLNLETWLGGKEACNFKLPTEKAIHKIINLEVT